MFLELSNEFHIVLVDLHDKLMKNGGMLLALHVMKVELKNLHTEGIRQHQKLELTLLQFSTYFAKQLQNMPPYIPRR